MQTLGHATSSRSRPAARAPAGVGGGRRRPRRWRRRRQRGGARPAGAGTGSPRRASGHRRALRRPARATRRRWPGRRGRHVRRRHAELTSALTYTKANGGGTLVISSQSGASQSIIQSGADVAAIGGFSGCETVVTTEWLANAVRSGRVRWVLTSGSGDFGANDGRVGGSQVMAAVAQVGRKVAITSGSSTTTLYDLSGRADALAAVAG